MLRWEGEERRTWGRVGREESTADANSIALCLTNTTRHIPRERETAFRPRWKPSARIRHPTFRGLSPARHSALPPPPPPLVDGSGTMINSLQDECRRRRRSGIGSPPPVPVPETAAFHLPTGGSARAHLGPVPPPRTARGVGGDGGFTLLLTESNSTFLH